MVVANDNITRECEISCRFEMRDISLYKHKSS